MYFDVWREDLAAILGKFETWRIDTNFYFLKVFIFFVLINDLAYWFAIATAYSEILTKQDELVYYSKVQFPVALLGALFDSLSLYITLLVVRRALFARSNLSYISHLSVDLIIAVLATFWVLFVFSISGWVVSLMPSDEIVAESLEERNKVYTDRAISAINNPTGEEEMKNIYFGIVMGLSAIIPTCIHLFYAIFSLRFFLKKHERLG